MEYLLQSLDKLKKKKDDLEKKDRKTFNIIMDYLIELEKLGGDIRMLSKDAMNAVVNDNFKKAKFSLGKAEKNIKKFNKRLDKIRKFLSNCFCNLKLKIGDFQNVYSRIENFEKDFSDAKEEFFEAKILYSYVKERKILKPKELLLTDFETYAGALSDFCGELLRKVRSDVVQKRITKKEVGKYHKEVQNIYQILANFSFSNKSGVRQKVENLKRCIQRFEDLLYDFK